MLFTPSLNGTAVVCDNFAIVKSVCAASFACCFAIPTKSSANSPIALDFDFLSLAKDVANFSANSPAFLIVSSVACGSDFAFLIISVNAFW